MTTTPRRWRRRLSRSRWILRRVSFWVLLFAVVVAFVGPFVAPYSPTENLGLPYRTPSVHPPLGTDILGRDVFSRVLEGGWTTVLMAAIATVLGYGLGTAMGLVAGYSRSWVDPLLMRIVDVMLSIPGLLFLLVLITGAGRGRGVVVIGIALLHAPGVARVIRAATQEVSVRGYVEAALVRGEPTRYIVSREILPNISGTIAAEFGIRLTGSIIGIASLNFLGLGISPPGADWALMTTENRTGFALNPWAVISPAVMIGLLSVSVGLLSEQISLRMGRSVDEGAVR